MIIGITGTPGTGKTSASALMGGVLDLNELIRGEGLYLGIDEARDSLIADMDAVYDRICGIARGEGRGGDGSGNLVIEGHLSHHVSDSAIVLRLAPDELERRLMARGYSRAKIYENALSEAVDVILVEAVDWCDRVYEIDTTGKTVEEVADAIKGILDAVDRGIEIEGYKPGSVDWLESEASCLVNFDYDR
ncbi:MAG: adenylate kinase family protein [Euryarchaeota archaeon]|nr:adenylate kinase family protein [Euryarchaeota archaeon]